MIYKTNNNFNSFQKKLKDIVPNIINNEGDLNKIKIIRLERNNDLRKLSTNGYQSARYIFGSNTNFQPVLTDISMIDKNKEKNKINYFSTDNLRRNESYIYSQNPYQKLKNDNIKLLIKIKELEQKNINNEKMIEKYKIEGNNFINRIQELEKTIQEYEIMNFNDMINSNNKQMEFSFENNEKRNETTKENQNLKNEIKKILNDNNELKLKIKSIEKKIYKNSNEKIFIPQSDNKTNNILKNSMVRNQSFIQKNSACNKSFRIINNISLNGRNYNKKNLPENRKISNSNNINDERKQISLDKIKNIGKINSNSYILNALKTENNI
jgi:hypothetical protein